MKSREPQNWLGSKMTRIKGVHSNTCLSLSTVTGIQLKPCLKMTMNILCIFTSLLSMDYLTHNDAQQVFVEWVK